MPSRPTGTVQPGRSSWLNLFSDVVLNASFPDADFKREQKLALAGIEREQNNCVGHYIPYAVIPDCGGSATGLSEVVSHELAEAMSDTDVGPTNPNYPENSNGGWYLGPTYPCTDPNNCPSNCGEIGDVCVNNGSTTVPGTSISAQYIWSQAQNGCDISNAGVGPQAGPTGTPATTRQ